MFLTIQRKKDLDLEVMELSVFTGKRIASEAVPFSDVLC